MRASPACPVVYVCPRECALSAACVCLHACVFCMYMRQRASRSWDLLGAGLECHSQGVAGLPGQPEGTVTRTIPGLALLLLTCRPPCSARAQVQARILVSMTCLASVGPLSPEWGPLERPFPPLLLCKFPSFPCHWGQLARRSPASLSARRMTQARAETVISDAQALSPAARSCQAPRGGRDKACHLFMYRPAEGP